MIKKLRKNPLFFGLTHVGQVFSIGWSEKMGSCAVSDFDKNKISNFENLKVTSEEPNLKKYLKKNKKKIKFCYSLEEIKQYKNVFLTIDTPLDNFGKPNTNKIIQSIKLLKPFLYKNSNLIITSQVYCGFCDDLARTILKDRKDINLIYFVETLIMGNAINRFLYPERIIIGCKKKINLFKEFKKFKCRVFIYSTREAEMVKIAVNLFLFNSVTYANLIDSYCRQYGFRFSKINEALRYDSRIGKKSYIQPSLGLGGGHLERDVFNAIKNSNNFYLVKIFKKMSSFNNTRMNLLIKKYNILQKKFKFKRIIWVGPSYKSESFSIVNSPFLKFRKFLNKKSKKLYSYDSFFNLEKEKLYLIYKHINKYFNRSLIILNYSSKKDLFKLNRLIQNKGSYIISLNPIKFEKNNLINY